MARPRSAPDLHLLSKVSTLYYLRDETQQQIADRLSISRPTVSRLLKEAKDQGIVRIAVSAPIGLHMDLEHDIERRFGLEEVHVVSVDGPSSNDFLQRHLGTAAAGYLSRVAQPKQSIGMAWGTTLNAMVQAVSPIATQRVDVVQILGGIGPPDSDAYAAGLVRRLAQLLAAAPVLLPAPGVVATPAVRNVLREDPHVSAALKFFDTLDVVFVGIGSIMSNPVLREDQSLQSGPDGELLDELREAGAVGDIALRFFDANGESIRTPFDDRILGITAEQLRKLPRVVAVAGGHEKVDAIRAALASKMVNVLITDQATAAAL